MKTRMSAVDRRKKRWVLMWAQGCICPACGGLIDPDAVSGSAGFGTLDHVETFGRGGAHALDNLLVKHRYCNEIRGDKLATRRDAEARKLVAERLLARPVTVADCEAAARQIYEVHKASRIYQPNAGRQRTARFAA